MLLTNSYHFVTKSGRKGKRFADIQNFVVASMVPAFKLAEILKQQIGSNSEANTLFSDMITSLGKSSIISLLDADK